ncbi:C45 family autoproteolytic acyltransferase/hydolase [Rhizosphaericola mali]|uniref:Peptidase C45 hydrolase domain-containing protein n=1 Tax=Rhizosphaericola mali TaxID=2545455 RepID=A0A5P2G5U5_9BACT|nr:C45 family peptidase [Rhizosphaericola mali]QES89222.1 hypothetical protein E0W69_011295 [Rhizosphaericola mali]
MKNFTTLFLLSLFVATNAQQKNTVKPKDVPVIELSGKPYDRGFQLGQTYKTETAALYKRWKEDLANSLQQDADSIIDDFYQNTHFQAALQKWTPDLLDEIKGLAAGSGQSYKDVYCFQLMDEFWVYANKKMHGEKHHCSGLGIAAQDGNPTYISQNLDAPNYMNGAQILIHLVAYKNHPEQYILSAAGLLALNGVNANGIGLTVNTLMDLQASDDGLPVFAMIRGILKQKNIKDALAFVQNVKHASGQNYIIGNADSVYDFEASSNKVVRYIPDPKNPKIVFHTNHAVANDDIKPWYKGRVYKDSRIRFDAIKNRLEAKNVNLNVATVETTLRSKDDANTPICRPFGANEYVFTFSSVIFTLGKNPTVQLTNGSPDQADYVLHTFNNNNKKD